MHANIKMMWETRPISESWTSWTNVIPQGQVESSDMADYI